MEPRVPGADPGLTEPAERIVEVRGVGLFVRSRGAGLPVLLVHGLGSSGRDWEPQIDALVAAGRRVVVPDLRAHGRSGRPGPPYGPELLADDLGELVAGLDLGPVDVVGISLGGMVALELAARHPGLVSSVVAINTPTDLRIRTPRHLGKLLLRLLVPYLFGMGAMARLLARRLFPEPGQEALRAIFVERWLGNDRRTWVRMLLAMVGWSVADLLPRIEQPVLALCAEHDYFPLVAQQRWVTRLPRGRMRVIPGGHHAVTAELPEEVNRVLAGWLSEMEEER